ncbi:Cytochrome P450 monooxygenase 58 [Psilocybe cubensis]|uniref:Cytochrome P450 n=2 Tax=Psilocybe cubensis TaxID=181762 RepID=A0A8H7XRY7_PSICU|nr:Cytochrome P450 monooxygenase 58 [Psilocybe cubensis]KAH9474637.1 Cytochrome P450 monooxygenase 58 [Psilocybe cubensis]
MIAILNTPIPAFLAAYALYWIMKWYQLRKIMPPGPLGLPFIGNKYQLPAIKPWKKFAEWNTEYGPVTSIFLGSTPVIVLGTAQPAWDLLEKRSDIYSSRPRFVVAGEILSDNRRGLMLPNNDAWRKWRKILHSGFHSRQAESYNDIQSLESKVLLKQILDAPEEYERHIQRFAASLAVSVTYGKRINSVDEWVVKANMDAMDWTYSWYSIPGKYLVESWPWLLKLPRSLQWFRREPEMRKKEDIRFLTHLLNDVKTRMANGTSQDCLASQSLANIKQIGMEEIDLAYAVSSPFGAGIETTSGSTTSFILAMLHWPEIQKLAQAELDAVVGQDRMPDYDDRGSLQYVQALVKETLRWRPVAILGGSPHAVTADDVYNGMFIPKGSTVYANMYGIMKDPEMFPEPDTFKPERFLKSTNPRLINFDLPFGFGRRACPGIHLALNSLFINISRILWAFDIKPAVDEHGQQIFPDVNNYTNGFNSRPVSFKCQLIPRNAKIKALIEAEWEGAKVHLDQWQA